MKTFIRWHGNKTKNIKKIIPYIPKEYDRYIEPFGGSAAIFLFLQPKKWVLNDKNKDLIMLWKTIQNNHTALLSYINVIGKILIPMSNSEKILYCRRMTSQIPKMKYSLKRAAIYLLMKQMAYMGTIMTNNQFYFRGIDLNLYKSNNSSFLSRSYQKNIQNVSNFLNNSQGHVYNKDYKEILKKCTQGDFVFLDPPYIEDYDYRIDYNLNENFTDLLEELYIECKNWIIETLNG